MEIYRNSESGGGAKSPARLDSQIRWGMLPVVVAVCVLAAMHVDHRGLNVDVSQLVSDGEKVRVAVDHVGSQRMPQQVRPDAPRDAPRAWRRRELSCGGPGTPARSRGDL